VTGESMISTCERRIGIRWHGDLQGQAGYPNARTVRHEGSGGVADWAAKLRPRL
jgi:hypothetical protein